MQEQQNIEWKETWRDEYLKWVCGFANAQGGTIYIGKNDRGEVVGVQNSKKLLEDIPNKIKDTMGIISDVNLLRSADKEYIEVIVNPSSYPVSYKGEYHYRSGSTKQQLKGSVLTEFLISKTGKKWDAVAVDNFTIENLDAESFDIFRKEALKSGRMTKKDLEMPRKDLLEKLGLLTNGKLKRAAVLLFHKNPEQLITGCFVKIGRFGQGSDLQYQDELRGSLLSIADKIIELIYLKYLKAKISYNREIRVETYPFPREGVREAIYNALIHTNFSDSIPIQIRIEDEAMYISNSCVLPAGWSTDTLTSKHKSRPYNPDIANTFFRAGYVETWGRGVEKICEACQIHGTPNPKFELIGNDITVKFTAHKDAKPLKPQNDALSDALNDALADKIKLIITKNPKVTQKEIADLLKVSRVTIQREIKLMLIQKQIERIGSKRFGYWRVTDNILERGVDKKCGNCKTQDIANLEFKLNENDITVKSTAHKEAKTLKRQNDALNDAFNDALADKIKLIITQKPKVTQKEIADLLKVSRVTIQREIKLMLIQKQIERVGSKRFGYWKVINEKND